MQAIVQARVRGKHQGHARICRRPSVNVWLVVACLLLGACGTGRVLDFSDGGLGGSAGAAGSGSGGQAGAGFNTGGTFGISGAAGSAGAAGAASVGQGGSAGSAGSSAGSGGMGVVDAGAPVDAGDASADAS